MWFRRKKEVEKKVELSANDKLRNKIKAEKEFNTYLSNAERQLKIMETRYKKLMMEAAEAKRAKNIHKYELKKRNLRQSLTMYNNISKLVNTFNALKEQKEMNAITENLLSTFQDAFQPLLENNKQVDFSKMIDNISEVSLDNATQATMLDRVLNDMSVNMNDSSSLDDINSLYDIDSMINEEVELQEAKIEALKAANLRSASYDSSLEADN